MVEYEETLKRKQKDAHLHVPPPLQQHVVDVAAGGDGRRFDSHVDAQKGGRLGVPPAETRLRVFSFFFRFFRFFFPEQERAIEEAYRSFPFSSFFVFSFICSSDSQKIIFMIIVVLRQSGRLTQRRYALSRPNREGDRLFAEMLKNPPGGPDQVC